MYMTDYLKIFIFCLFVKWSTCIDEAVLKLMILQLQLDDHTQLSILFTYKDILFTNKVKVTSFSEQRVSRLTVSYFLFKEFQLEWLT